MPILLKKGCIIMRSNESNNPKNVKHKAASPKNQQSKEKNKTNDPPGVSMPPEKEMSPPQFG